MCTVLLSSGGYPIAFNKYIISTGDIQCILLTDLNMTHYLTETCSLNASHVQSNTALSLTELSFLIQVIRTTGLVHGQLAHVELFH